MRKMSRVSRTRLWLDRLNRQATSGQTVADFCRSEGVSTPSFYQWRHRLAPRVDTPPRQRTPRRRNRPERQSIDGFAELIVQPAGATAQATLPGGITLSLGNEAEIVAVIIDCLLQYSGQPEGKSRW